MKADIVNFKTGIVYLVIDINNNLEEIIDFLIFLTSLKRDYLIQKIKNNNTIFIPITNTSNHIHKKLTKRQLKSEADPLITAFNFTGKSRNYYRDESNIIRYYTIEI